ncbi:hypothetical protein CDL12_06821 [Handroanthus impetiginosus]|uniref:Uncharacterized protein n=1 Tax=Handroanthus impetiginosus TaxID=429701 RepID=A0A2G9HSK2_9LAMI|nr:hypothetical protein CDL12_06821 [Handroanthus impetiginosus]
MAWVKKSNFFTFLAPWLWTYEEHKKVHKPELKSHNTAKGRNSLVPSCPLMMSYHVGLIKIIRTRTHIDNRSNLQQVNLCLGTLSLKYGKTVLFLSLLLN